MALIANMVGKDEEGRYLREVLEHLNGIADTVVFSDDGSSDATPDIAEEMGAHVYRFAESRFGVDEGALRADAWRNLENHAKEGDWVLAIDCDEKLWCTSDEVDLDQIMNQNDFDVVNVTFVHMWNENEFRIDKLWHPHSSTRFFRYLPGGQFAQRKLACGSEPTYVNQAVRAGRYLRNSGLVMQHLGYVRDEDKKAKFDRYMTIDGGDFHAKQHIESIMDPDPVLQEWGL